MVVFLSYWENFIASEGGVSFPDDEVRNSIVFTKEGKIEKFITPEFVQGLIIQGLQHPNYKGIECPALAIYAKPLSTFELFPFYSSLDAENRKKADTTLTSFIQFGTEQEEKFKKEIKMKTVKEINGANHYVFISNPVETEKFIRDFLKYAGKLKK